MAGRVISSILSVACLLFFVSCSVPAVRKGPSDDLQKTVNEFYELRKLGRFDEAWRYERMATDGDENMREKNRKIYISRSGAMSLKDFELIGIGEENSGSEGTTPVRIKLVTDWPVMPFPVPEGDRVLIMNDLWEKIKGRWYHVVRGMTKLW
ncbi:MAG: hypothetical protein RDU01_11755 [Thermodesulfovibrionales bacterium]|nr:hypothetical protein [Thermodesulfovibrionales bacterium]